MYTLISGSPKLNSSNSLYFLKIIASKLNVDKIYKLKNNNYDEILNNIENSDVIVLALPLYVDSPTSITLDFFDYIIDKKINLENKLIYVLINCGFREGEQNITAINIIKNWCKKVSAKYNGSILIGAGEIVGKEKYKFISRKALKQITKFCEYIKSNKECNDIITTMDLLNNKLYCFLANHFWSKKGKLNRLSNLDLRIR